MMTRMLDDQEGLKTFTVILETGDEVMTSRESFSRAEGVDGA